MLGVDIWTFTFCHMDLLSYIASGIAAGIASGIASAMLGDCSLYLGRRILYESLVDIGA